MPLSVSELSSMDRLASVALSQTRLGVLERSARQYESIFKSSLVTMLERQQSIFQAGTVFDDMTRTWGAVDGLVSGKAADLLGLSDDWFGQNIGKWFELMESTARFSDSINVQAFDAAQWSKKLQGVVANITPSLLNDVARKFEFADPFADLRSTLETVLEHLDEDDESTAGHPLADPGYRARQAMTQASVVIAFLLAGVAVHPPKTARDLLPYLMSVWALIFFIGWLMDDE